MPVPCFSYAALAVLYGLFNVIITSRCRPKAANQDVDMTKEQIKDVAAENGDVKHGTAQPSHRGLDDINQQTAPGG